MKAMTSIRQKRVANQIRQCIGEELVRRDLYGSDGRKMLVTITDVSVSADLHVAHVFISSSHADDETLAALEKCDLRTCVAKFLKTKFAPYIECRFDDVEAHARKIEQLLNAIPPYADQDGVDTCSHDGAIDCADDDSQAGW